MQVAVLNLGMFETNCFIVYGGEPGKCILIDPADGARTILAVMEKKGLIPEAVLLTHGHYDHILAVPALQEVWPDLPVFCHPADIPREKTEYDMGQYFPTVAAFRNLRHLKDGQMLHLAGLDIEVIASPGHTPGSVVFRIGEALFTGDTLFRRNIGRTDFAGGSQRDMMKSLKKLAALPLDDAPVYPGHEGMTTLSEERRYNPYLRFYER